MVHKSSLRFDARGILNASVATTSAADTSSLTYNNGVLGVGATFTGAVNTSLTVDGITLNAVGQTLFVKNDTQTPSGAFNGLYYVLQLQTVSLPLILARSANYNAPSAIDNIGAISVTSGTINSGTLWLLTNPITTIGTDPINYEEVGQGSLTGYVPYTGAVNNVDLGAYSLTANGLNSRGEDFLGGTFTGAAPFVGTHIDPTFHLTGNSPSIIGLNIFPEIQTDVGVVLDKAYGLYVTSPFLKPANAGTINTYHGIYVEKSTIAGSNFCITTAGQVNFAGLNINDSGVVSAGVWHGTAIDGAYLTGNPTFTGITINGTSAFNGELNVNQNSIATSDGNAVNLFGTIPGGTFSVLTGLVEAHTFNINTINTTYADGIEVSPIFNVGAGLTLSDSMGVYIKALTKTGAGTNTRATGLYIEEPTAGTTNYAARLFGAMAVGTSGQFNITRLGVINGGTWNADKIGLPYGGLNADLSATGGVGNYLKQITTGAAITVGTIPASDIGSGAALTRTNDTNVTITLGGAPTTALLAATSLTLGWTGNLGTTRGGTNLNAYAQGDIIYCSATNVLTTLASTPVATRYLSNTGGSFSGQAAWSQIDLTNGVTGVTPANNGGTGFPANWANGQIPIGITTSGILAQATLTPGTSTGIVIINGAGSITIANAQDIRTTASLIFFGLIVSGTSNNGISTSGTLAANTSAFSATNTTAFTAASHAFFNLNGTLKNTAASPTDGSFLSVNPTFQSTNTLTDARFIYVNQGSGSGSGYTNAYGVYIEAPSIGATNSWSLWSKGRSAFGSTKQTLIDASGVLTLGTALGTGSGGTGTATTFTSTAMIYAGASGVYTQDASFFAYDSGQHRLSIGTNTFLGNIALHIFGINGVLNATAAFNADTATAKATCQFLTAGAIKWELGKSVNGVSNDFSVYDAVASASPIIITTGGNITLGNNSSSQFTYNGVSSATASTTVGGLTLPVLAAGYLDIIINGTHRKVPYYTN